MDNTSITLDPFAGGPIPHAHFDAAQVSGSHRTPDAFRSAGGTDDVFGQSSSFFHTTGDMTTGSGSKSVAPLDVDTSTPGIGTAAAVGCCACCCLTCAVAMNIFNTLAFLASVALLITGIVTVNPVFITIGAVGTAVFGLAFFGNCCCHAQTSSVDQSRLDLV
ncbi:MAG: hypothetical protein HY860_04070 [Chlamydiales bacterium]|nr:hypothetical protein [Chlamydiales bacterium]